MYGRSDLTAADMTTVDGIPCTSVARTLLDLAAVLDDAAVEKAIDRAEQLRVFDGRAVDDVLARNAGRRGAGRLRRVLANLDPGSGRTRREFERRFFAFCRDRNLPVPQVNVPIQLEDILFIADFLWPTARLIIETDSWEIHGTRVAFHRDRRRDQLLDRADYRTLRVTWRDLTEEPDRLEDTIRHRLTSADNRTPLSREAALDRAA